MTRLCLVLVFLALLSSGAFADGPRLGIGFFGGVDVPVAQQDQSMGPVFGFRARFEVIPTIVLEPNVAISDYGSSDFDEFENDLEGSKVTAFGLDVILGRLVGTLGFKPYVFAGVGLYDRSNETTDVIYDSGGTRLGWSVGLGMGLGLSPSLDLDARGKFHVVPAKEGGSRKSLAIIGGLNYYLGGK